MFTSQQTQSHVRDACDACHRRKIRCVASSEGGACHHCQSRGLSCYFLPRHRSGRPRLNQPRYRSGRPRSDQLQLSSPVATDHDAPQILPPYPRVAAHGPGSDIFEGHPHKDAAITLQQQDYRFQDSEQRLRSPSITDNVLLDLPQHSLFQDFTASSQHPFADVSDHGGVFETPLTPLSAKTPTPSWLTPSQGPPDRRTSNEFQNRTFQEYAFSNLLQQFLKLQRHLVAAENISDQVLDDGNIFPSSQRAEMPDSQLLMMLEDVETNCKLTLEICEKGSVVSKPASGQPASPPENIPSLLLDPALISLITAVIFKILQVCNVLLSDAGLKARSISDVLLYKRLDVSITLARIIMSKVEGLALNKLLPWQELSNRAVHIERVFAEKRKKIESNIV